MFCKHCGNHVRDDARFCPSCGASTAEPQYQPVQPQQQYQYQPQNQAPATKSENPIAIVGFVLCFIIPLAGLICSIIGYNNAKKGAPYGGLALAGIIISTIYIVLVFIFLMIFIMYYSAFWRLIFWPLYYS
ncbi:MAG: zinc-ribbon domain-containing protein [Clostridiales bacterium]|nr:zinc-ribbon domain-containing protein [Clostridiales bacterium]